MRQMNRDRWLSLGLVLLMLVVLVFSAVQELRQETEQIPLNSASDAPTGALALSLWLERLDIEVEAGLQANYGVPAGTDIAFLLAPVIDISLTERQQLQEWVRAGGTLVVADDSLPFQSKLIPFEVELDILPQADGEALTPRPELFAFGGSVQPVTALLPLAAAPFTEPLAGPVNSYFAAVPVGAYVWLTRGEYPVAIVWPQGRGQLVLSTVAWPFANAGLQEPMAPELVLNLLALSNRPVDRVWFDEWHHGLRLSGGAVAGGGPAAWLRGTAGGHAVLFTLALAFVAVLLGGRRLGRPVPLRQDISRRAPLEYITAMANLNRRAGHRQEVQRHYHTQLKRGLGERYRLNPTLPDDEYVDRLLGYRPDLDEPRLRQLLNRLRQQKLNEPDLVATANEVADLLATTRQHDQGGN